jgi:hypothetical protein
MAQFEQRFIHVNDNLLIFKPYTTRIYDQFLAMSLSGLSALVRWASVDSPTRPVVPPTAVYARARQPHGEGHAVLNRHDVPS